MVRLSRVVVAVSLAAVLAVSQSAWAQGRGRGQFFGSLTELRLAQLDSVQKELKLTDEQKQAVKKLNEELQSKSRELFQNAGGDFAKVRTESAKLNDEYNGKFTAALDEGQKKRALEIYMQVVGPSTLLDERVAKQLGISDEQKQKLEKANDDSNAEIRSLFRGSQDLSREERAEKFQKLNESRDQALLAVLTGPQKEQFEKLKGEKIDIDLSQMPRTGRRQQ